MRIASLLPAILDMAFALHKLHSLFARSSGFAPRQPNSRAVVWRSRPEAPTSGPGKCAASGCNTVGGAASVRTSKSMRTTAHYRGECTCSLALCRRGQLKGCPGRPVLPGFRDDPMRIMRKRRQVWAAKGLWPAVLESVT